MNENGPGKKITALYQTLLAFPPPNPRGCQGSKILSPSFQAAVIFLVSLLPRIGFSLQNGALILPDAYGRYMPLAKALYTRWIGSPYDTPGFPIFLRLVWDTLGEGFEVIAVQCGLGALSVVLVWDIARRMGLQWLGWIPTVYMMFDPNQLLFANAILSEVLFTVLLLAILWQFCRLQAESGPWGFAFLGLTVGLLTLTRANGILVLLVIAGMVFLCRFQLPWFKRLGIFAATTLLLILPWVVFNYRTHGVMAITQGSGFQLVTNLAHFELVKAQDFQAPHDEVYKNMFSLGAIRDTMLYGIPRNTRGSVDPKFKAIADKVIARDRAAYFRTIPQAILLPRDNLKDLRDSIKRPNQWGHYLRQANQTQFGGYGRALDPEAAYNRFFNFLNRQYTVPYKLPMMMGVMIPAFLIAYVRRKPTHFLTAAIPLGMSLALALMLNPISRYFYPLEPLMLLSIVAMVQPLVTGRQSPL